MNCKICGKPTKKRNGVPNYTCGTACSRIYNKLSKPQFVTRKK